jgi:hypothetical protein
MIEFKIFLLRKGFNQSSFALHVGISVQYMSDIVLGKRRAPKLRRRLIDEFGVPSRLIAYRPIKKAA